MAIDWQEKVDRPRLQCRVTGAIIAPGQRYYSALSWREGGFARYDYSEEGWERRREIDDGEPLSWWRHRRPEAREDSGPRLVNAAILLGIFHDLKEATDRPQRCFAWLLALLLIRKRKFRYLDLEHDGDTSWLLVEERGVKAIHRIRDPAMDAAEQDRLQADLEQLFEMPAAVVHKDHGTTTA